MSTQGQNGKHRQAAGSRPAPSAIILAAGIGKRMQSDLPKVLHPVGAPPRPMVCPVIDACREAGCARIVLVVGHGQDRVRAALKDIPGLEYVEQPRQLGTGHAVRCAEGLFHVERAHAGHPLFVLAGDGPLIRARTLSTMLEQHRESGAAATLASSVIPDPTGYGRIVRDAPGRFTGIVEHKDCTPEQLAIREVYPSYACFDAQALFLEVSRLPPNARSGEYYITDVPANLLRTGARVDVIPAVPPEDVLSINTPEQLAEVDAIYRGRARPGAGLRAESGGRRA